MKLSLQLSRKNQEQKCSNANDPHY